jgi:iron complex outermembrane receptor protein
MNVSSRLVAGASLLPLLFASAAVAQTEAGAAPTAIGEVVVTARHRSENLQEVPISVSVVSGVQAAAQNLNDLGDISQIVPAIDFRTGASNKDRTIFIRGIGTISTSPGVEPSVSTVIDGVVLARPGMATLDLLDLDHIEVLQGPQGTLFGKNASAGVINIVTANPTATPHAYVDASYYEGSEYRLKAGVSGPIAGDKLEGLVSVFTAQYRGNVENIYNGVDKEDAGYRHTGARAKFIAKPVDNLVLTLGGDYTNSSDTTPTGVYAATSRIAYPSGVLTPNPNLAAALAAAGITPSPDNRTISTNTNSSVHDKNGGVSLQADWTVFGDYTITSISAYRKWKNVQYQDYDMLGMPVGPAGGNFAQGVDTGHVDFDQESQELRIASPKGHFIDYVAGFYYLHASDAEIYERDITQINAAGAAVLNNGVAHYGTTGDNYALFGEANVNITKQFRAIAGYREIWDDLSYYHNRVSTSATAVPGVGTSIVNGPSSVSRSGYADRFGLQFDVTPDITTYATYSRGYKGPAFNVFFNMAAVNTAPLAAETSNDYEAGVKSSLFDHRLTANVGGFITNFSNYQANFASLIAGAVVTNLINAGSVSTKGVSVDLTARPVQPLTLDANLIYDDAYVGVFNCPPNAPTSCNINGQALPFAPRYKMHLGGEYRVPVAGWGDLALQSDYNWQSKVQYLLSENADTIQGGYGIWNAAIALLDPKDGWQARVLVKNILDQHYSSYLAGGTFGGVVRWVPRDDNRYFGVNLRKDF